MSRRLRGRRACRGNLSGVEKLDAPSLRCWMNPELRPSQEGREDHSLPAVKGWAGMHCSTGRVFILSQHLRAPKEATGQHERVDMRATHRSGPALTPKTESEGVTSRRCTQCPTALGHFYKRTHGKPDK